MIEALGLTMRFGRRTVVDRLSFRVGRGELCAFLGRNGAGKTTTMRLLAGRSSPGGRQRTYQRPRRDRGTMRSRGLDRIPSRGGGRFLAPHRRRIPPVLRRIARPGRTNARRGDRPRRRACARARSAGRADGRALERLAPEGMARTGAPARPSGADPGRAHRRSRSGSSGVTFVRCSMTSRGTRRYCSRPRTREGGEIATRVVLIARGRIVADDVPASLVDERGRLAPAFHRLAGNDPEGARGQS